MNNVLNLIILIYEKKYSELFIYLNEINYRINDLIIRRKIDEIKWLYILDDDLELKKNIKEFVKYIYITGGKKNDKKIKEEINDRRQNKLLY